MYISLSAVNGIYIYYIYPNIYLFIFFFACNFGPLPLKTYQQPERERRVRCHGTRQAAAAAKKKMFFYFFTFFFPNRILIISCEIDFADALPLHHCQPGSYVYIQPNC
jgi:hypothetical protein